MTKEIQYYVSRSLTRTALAAALSETAHVFHFRLTSMLLRVDPERFAMTGQGRSSHPFVDLPHAVQP